MPGTSAAVSKQTGIHSVVRHGEAASSDKRRAEEFVDKFKEYVEAEGFLPQQVFNCDEMGLYWKKMPKRTYITQEEKALPGHKPMKDRLSLLLCANASGDFKLKPLLVYHTQNPRVFDKYNVVRSKLCVMWTSNIKSRVTRLSLLEWLYVVFGPSVKQYLQKNNLPLKCLLVLGNAPAHPLDLEELLMWGFPFVTVKCFPPNTTSLIQPMDQQVISNFKKLYTKAMFQRCFEATSNTELTLREFWRNHFNIYNCLGLIGKAWHGVTSRTLNSAWRKLWPECVLKNFQRFEADSDDPTLVVESIVCLGESLGLDVSGQDVEELLDDHREELTFKELQHLILIHHENIAEELDSEEEEEIEEIVPSSVYKDMCAKWNELQSFVEKYHPDEAVVSHTCNMFSDNAMSHFRHILKRRQKQTSLDRYFVRQGFRYSQAGPSASKRQRIGN